ncbi:hypothetical protein GCM10011516_29790 [Sphingobacterium cellulitidis]|uniref:Uncharacterized protein n=1 Tax=Sphingobacterium cellulitidis TaxID=1768011 RepID=A0A8H9G0Y1_9SPHI|nr:hypothetical protein GCM10011516_29790 [Sphingobacterium soli]
MSKKKAQVVKPEPDTLTIINYTLLINFEDFYLRSRGGTWHEPFAEQPIFNSGKIVNNTPKPAINHISDFTP